jgi:hypothetical protein
MTTEQLLYYEVDTGHFNVKIKVCFSDEAFQQAVRNSKITTKHSALDLGIAESHYIHQDGTLHSMLGIVFNYEEMKKLDALERMGIIYHEVSHTTTHVFQYIGEDEAKIGDESRSYLGEHIFKQVFAIYATEDDNRESARKRNRKVSHQTNQAIVGTMLQMAFDGDGSAGQDSVSEPKNTPSRVKNGNGKTKPKTSARIRRT